jgi:hypothetical protein
MKTIGWLILFAVYTSPLTFILSGCQWKPDAPGNVIHVKTSDFLTPKVKPVAAPVVEQPAEPAKPVTYDPLRVPTEDDPYAKPPRVTLLKSNPPLVNAEELCTDGSCSVQGDGGGGFRLFPRLRGRR